MSLKKKRFTKFLLLVFLSLVILNPLSKTPLEHFNLEITFKLKNYEKKKPLLTLT